MSHKNRLQEYTQRSSLPFPVYQTINEGSPNAPMFRSTVSVDGAEYTSPNTFSHRKTAEQDVAKLALEHITKSIKDEPNVLEEKDFSTFSKSILNEFAVKMGMENPNYKTYQPEATVPVFVSTLIFNGATYTGEMGRNKKEAEQLVARAAILSILADSGSAVILSEIIRSKQKLCAPLHKVKDQYAQYITLLGGINAGDDQKPNAGDDSKVLFNENKENSAVVMGDSATAIANPQIDSEMSPPHHEIEVVRPDPSAEAINLPITFVHPVFGQPLSDGSKKRRKNKKKANKKMCTNSLSPDASMAPLAESSSCPVASMAPLAEASSCPATSVAPLAEASSCPVASMAPLAEASSCPVASMAPLDEASSCPVASMAPLAEASPCSVVQ